MSLTPSKHLWHVIDPTPSSLSLLANYDMLRLEGTELAEFLDSYHILRHGCSATFPIKHSIGETDKLLPEVLISSALIRARLLFRATNSGDWSYSPISTLSFVDFLLSPATATATASKWAAFGTISPEQQQAQRHYVYITTLLSIACRIPGGIPAAVKATVQLCRKLSLAIINDIDLEQYYEDKCGIMQSLDPIFKLPTVYMPMEDCCGDQALNVSKEIRKGIGEDHHSLMLLFLFFNQKIESACLSVQRDPSVVKFILKPSGGTRDMFNTVVSLPLTPSRLSALNANIAKMGHHTHMLVQQFEPNIRGEEYRHYITMEDGKLVSMAMLCTTMEKQKGTISFGDVEPSSPVYQRMSSFARLLEEETHCISGYLAGGGGGCVIRLDTGEMAPKLGEPTVPFLLELTTSQDIGTFTGTKQGAPPILSFLADGVVQRILNQTT